MVSGKYSALSGAVAREQTLANIANNLANVNSTGFKKDKVGFESILRGVNQAQKANGINYSRIRTIATDFSQGGMQETGRSLDVAIDGEGFFKVQRGDEFFYTRAGRLVLDEDGMLKTEDGLNVLGEGNAPLQLDTLDGKEIVIGDNGEISVNGLAADGRLQIYTVTDQEKLVKAGNTLYRLDQGAADQPAEDSRIIQGSLETSNVKMMEEMVAMITSQRHYEVYHKVLEGYSTLGEKQSELGSLG